MAISPIPVSLSPLSAALSLIHEAIGSSAVADAEIRDRADVDADVARLTKQRKTLLNIVKHHEMLVKHCETS